MKENEIQNFWQTHPCGAELVGDLAGDERGNYLEFFDRYDEYRYSTESHILENLRRTDFKKKCVLEIGLGQGADAERIARDGARYSGVDLTHEAVRRTQMRFDLKGLPYERIKKASALSLPFDDSSFDIVYSHGVLHHIPKIATAQDEIARVLKPDGILIAMLYAKYSLNYLISISILRRLGLSALYAIGIRPGGIYDHHLDNAKRAGLKEYLRMENFLNVSTDGPGNPYSKVYDVAAIEKDFSAFEIVSTRKHFMHAAAEGKLAATELAARLASLGNYETKEHGGPMRILIGVPSPDSWGGPAACEPPFAEALRATGHQVKEVVYVYGDKVERASAIARFRRVMKTVEELRTALKAERFDIVHLNTSFDLKTILRDAYCIYRMPGGRHRIFLKMHGSDARGYQNAGPVVTRLVRYIARRADAIGVLSSEERDDFIALGFDESKIYRVLNVVELEGVYERSPARRDEIALLFVSRLIAAKGLLETIKAAKILKDQNYSILLTVVGDGELRRDAEALASELSMNDEIRFTGYVAESEVARRMSRSDIFVFPTRHIEGLPIALYKAAIAGLAIVTTPVRSARDLMSDGENCLFCESEPTDVAAKIARLIGDARLMQNMADNNRKFRETLSREKVASEYLAIYSEIVTM